MSKRFTSEQGTTIVKVKDRDGRYRGRTKEVPRRVRGLSNVQKILFAKPSKLMSARKGIR